MLSVKNSIFLKPQDIRFIVLSWVFMRSGSPMRRNNHIKPISATEG
jgi:hypothetical protein